VVDDHIVIALLIVMIPMPSLRDLVAEGADQALIGPGTDVRDQSGGAHDCAGYCNHGEHESGAVVVVRRIKRYG
jgi:hypothetical protein